MLSKVLKYCLLLTCLTLIVGCIGLPHDIIVEPAEFKDSVSGLPEYAYKGKTISFTINCNFDSVVVVKVKTLENEQLVRVKSHVNKKSCSFLMPSFDVAIVIFQSDQVQMVANEAVNNTPAPPSHVADNARNTAVPSPLPSPSPSPTPSAPGHQLDKPKTVTAVDSVTVKFNLCLGQFARAVETDRFVYTRKFAKGKVVNIANCAPQVRPEVTDIRFLGWTLSESSSSGSVDFTFTHDVTLYAVWQTPPPPVQAEGTQQNPIKITCIEDLKKMEGSSLCFVLATDNLVISSTVHRVSQFNGTFDGNGHRLTISSRNCFIKENRGTIQNLQIHIKSSGCHLCNNNRGTIDDITVTLEKDIKELNQAVITYTNYGIIGRRIRKTWSSKNVKEPKSILYVYNK